MMVLYEGLHRQEENGLEKAEITGIHTLKAER